MKTRRSKRVGDMIAREVALILQRDIAFSSQSVVTVTGATISNDLRIAHVYVSVLGDEGKRDATIRELKRATGFIRREIGHSIRLKYTPEIHFHYDDSIERGQRILAEIEALHLDTGTDVE